MARRPFHMLPCKMPGVEAVVAETSHRFPRHTHEAFGIGVIHRGAQKSLSGRGMVEAGAGDLITVNPGEVHDGAPIGDDGRSWRMLYLDPILVAETMRDLSEGKVAGYEFHHPVIGDPGLARCFAQLFASLTEGDETGGDASGEMRREESLLLLLARMRQESNRGDVPVVAPGILAARRLIDDDPAAPVTLADLAAASGLSRFQVLRGFVKATALTPHAYLVQRRIALARRLIAGGTALADAAGASGFADQSHMTRIFVRKYGISPGIYAAAVS